MCAYGWFMLLYSRSQHNTVNNYPPIKKKKPGTMETGMGRAVRADAAELMSFRGTMGPSLPCWVLLSWDMGELTVLTTPRVHWSYSAVYAESSCQVWDKLTVILG